MAGEGRAIGPLQFAPDTLTFYSTPNMEGVKVKFLKSISTGIGSFAPGQVEIIPADHVKPWVDQEVCEICKTDEKPVGEVRPARVDDIPKVPAAAKTKSAKNKKQ